MIRPRRDCTRVDQSSGLFSFPIADTPLGRTKTAIGSHRADAQIDKSMAASRRSGRARTPSKCSSRCFETTSSGSFRSTGAANPLAAKLIVCFRFLCASLRFELEGSKAPSGRESRVQLIKASGRRWMIIARNNARKYPRSGWLWRGKKKHGHCASRRRDQRPSTRPSVRFIFSRENFSNEPLSGRRFFNWATPSESKSHYTFSACRPSACVELASDCPSLIAAAAIIKCARVAVSWPPERQATGRRTASERASERAGCGRIDDCYSISSSAANTQRPNL